MKVCEALLELADPRPDGEPVKRAIERVSRKWGGSYWRTYDLWYGKARRVEEYEIDAIADALRVKREREAANELHELRTRLARLESRMAQTDEDFYRPNIDYTRETVC